MNSIALLIAALVMISVFFSIANYICWRLFARPRHALLWSVTYALIAIQYSLNLLRGGRLFLSSEAFWLSANTLSFLLVLCAHWAHRQRLGLAAPAPVFWAVFALMSLLNLVIVFSDLRDLRLAIAPAFVFLNMAAITWILLVDESHLRLPQRFAAGAHFFFGLTQLAAASIAVYGGNDMPPPLQQVYYLTNFLLMPALYVAMGVSVILLLATDLSQQLRVQALTDQLTGLNNRRGFLAASERMLARVQRSGGTLGMILCDVDHFKRVNDTYGHGVGDDALRRLAEIIDAAVRAGDESGRIGGEEFAICVEGMSAADARLVAERINRQLAEAVIETRKGPLTITASFGVAIAREGDQIDDLLQRADGALYAAKDAGRNTVVIETAATP